MREVSDKPRIVRPGLQTSYDESCVDTHFFVLPGSKIRWHSTGQNTKMQRSQLVNTIFTILTYVKHMPEYMYM